MADAHQIIVNKSGVTGISWHKPLSKWRAVIGVNNKAILIEYFTNLQDATSARKEAEREYWGI